MYMYTWSSKLSFKKNKVFNERVTERITPVSYVLIKNIAKNEQSSHTPGGSYHRPYHLIGKTVMDR